MKTKKLSRKLVLNKETIVHMDDNHMENINGGLSTFPCINLSLLDCNTVTRCWTVCTAPNAC